MTQHSTRAGSMGLILLAVVAAILVALKHFVGLDIPQWVRIGVLVVVVGIAAGSTWSWWGALDEVAREAHKFAWYWGGSLGMAAAGVLLIAVDSGYLPAPNLFPGAHSGFAVGAMTVMFAQIAGYLVTWAGWWWSHR